MLSGGGAGSVTGMLRSREVALRAFSRCLIDAAIMPPSLMVFAGPLGTESKQFNGARAGEVFVENPGVRVAASAVLAFNEGKRTELSSCKVASS